VSPNRGAASVRVRTERPPPDPADSSMDLFVWILVGSLVGWVGYARFNFNEGRGRNVSIILGALGALIGAKIAPMFVAMPAGEFNAPGVFIAAGAATVVLVLGNLVYERWGV